MAFSREQLRIYWATNKAALNAKRREKRRLVKLAKANKPTIEEVSPKLVNLTSKKSKPVSHLLVGNSQVIKGVKREVSHLSPEEAELKEKKVSLNISNQGSYEQVSHSLSIDTEQVSQTIRNQANKANLGASLEVSQKARNQRDYEQDNRLNCSESKEVSHQKAKKVSRQSDLMANPTLSTLINQWLTSTNYACSTTCDYAYCNNCWYFEEEKLVDYKHVSS